MKIIIKPKKITRKNFQKFGDLISVKKKKSININDGYAKRFDNLCRINTSSKKGKTIMSIFSAKKRKFPMNIKMMEKHPLGSQAFVPMNGTTFLVNSIILFLLSSIPLFGSQDTEESYVRAESLVVVVQDNVSHDSAAYSQGLEFHQGRLFDSTGLYGNSTLREVNLSSGSVIRSVDMIACVFGEG